MTDADPTTVQRLRELRETQTSTALEHRAQVQGTDAAAKGTFSVGARVLDRVSGQEGVIVSPLPVLGKAAGLIEIRLDRGDLIIRPASQLLWRPTPPTA